MSNDGITGVECVSERLSDESIPPPIPSVAVGPITVSYLSFYVANLDFGPFPATCFFISFLSCIPFPFVTLLQSVHFLLTSSTVLDVWDTELMESAIVAMPSMPYSSYH